MGWGKNISIPPEMYLGVKNVTNFLKSTAVKKREKDIVSESKLWQLFNLCDEWVFFTLFFTFVHV